jgi:hypothetical protein
VVTTFVISNRLLDERCLSLLPDTDNNVSANCVSFMRSTVILSDTILWLGAGAIAWAATDSWPFFINFSCTCCFRASPRNLDRCCRVHSFQSCRAVRVPSLTSTYVTFPTRRSVSILFCRSLSTLYSISRVDWFLTTTTASVTLLLEMHSVESLLLT